MLQKYNESDFELMHLDYSRFILEKKVSKESSPFFFFFVKDIFFYFRFCNVVNLDNFFIQRFFLVLWLFIGSVGYVSKYKNHLRLGKYYYHFLIKYFIKIRKFYFFISFLLDDFISSVFDDGWFYANNKYILVFKDLNILTNKKLARGVYFHRIQQNLYLELKIIKKSSEFFFNYLNSLKLCDLIKKV